LTPGDGISTAYYAAHGFESAGGRRLADCIAREVAMVTDHPVGEPMGMSVPVLRETRMPAVLCELGPAALVVEQGGALAAALTRALARWTQALEHV
jgi:N-acetylmuramoyl-L-alanine amidase